MVALKPVVGWTAAVGLCLAVAAVGITPVGAKPKATSWDKQGLTGIRGIDVSRWQHVGPGRLDFPALQAQGVRFVIIKSGDSYPSAHSEAGYWYRRDKAAAKRAGMLVGAYYYAVPTSRAKHVIADARAQGRKGLVLTCKEKLLHYYAKFGFVNEGVSASTHGGVVWYQMRLRF